MKSFDRKAYNSSYYAQNRQKILLNRKVRKARQREFNDKPDDVQLSLFAHSTGCLKRSNLFQSFKWESALNFALITLVILDSCYLLGEAVEFYRASGMSSGKSALAAMIVELMIIALSTIRQSNGVLKALSKTALALLFLYSSWSFCSSIVGKGMEGLDQIEILDRQIERTKADLKARDALIGENLRLHRITLAGAMTKEKSVVAAELGRLESERKGSVTVSPGAQLIDLLSAVGLRLLIQLSNIIILHHLSAAFRRTQRKPNTKQRELAPVFHLVH